jgi:hypothetical protein
MQRLTWRRTTDGRSHCEVKKNRTPTSCTSSTLLFTTTAAAAAAAAERNDFFAPSKSPRHRRDGRKSFVQGPVGALATQLQSYDVVHIDVWKKTVEEEDVPNETYLH